MKIYLGHTRSQKLIDQLNAKGYGEMTCRGEFPPRRHPWCYDNGAFKDWTNGKSFDREKFMDDIAEIRDYEVKPDFIVLPDIVGAGERSFDFSWEWIPQLLKVAPLYFAVQDGMDQRHLEEIQDYIAGILVGGTLSWKISTGEQWAERAHRLGKKCHMGRAGTANRAAWCRRIGVDSLDSCLPLWSEGNMARFTEGLNRLELPFKITHVA